MKLNFKKKNKKNRFWLSIFFILIFYLFFHFFGNKINNFLINFQKNQKIIFAEKENLLLENTKLKKINEKIKIKNIFSNYYYNEVQKLEKKLNYWNENKIERKSFNIIYNNKNNIYNELLAKNYLNSGIKKTDKVFLFGNFVIGEVFSVGENFIKIKQFSNYGLVKKYLIIQNGKILFKVDGFGDSNGIIKVSLPRDIVPDKNSILVLDNEEKSIVGIFLRDDFKSQKVKRDVYYKVFYNINTLMEVEI